MVSVSALVYLFTDILLEIDAQCFQDINGDNPIIMEQAGQRLHLTRSEFILDSYREEPCFGAESDNGACASFILNFITGQKHTQCASSFYSRSKQKPLE